MALIFSNALNYVQEKEEPVDFLDLFIELDNLTRNDFGIEYDLKNDKHKKNGTLNPLLNAHSNMTFSQGISPLQQSLMSSTTNSLGSIQKSNRTNKLCPLKVDNEKQKNEQSIIVKTQPQQNKEFQQVDPLYLSLFNKRRLQQIEFLPTNINNFTSSPPQPNNRNTFYYKNNTKTNSSPFTNKNSIQIQNKANNNQNSSNNRSPPSDLLATTYSLKNGNSFLKKHFHLEIGKSQDQSRSYHIKKVKYQKGEIKKIKKEQEAKDEENEGQNSNKNRLITENRSLNSSCSFYQKLSTNSQNNSKNAKEELQQLMQLEYQTSLQIGGDPMVNLKSLLSSSMIKPHNIDKKTIPKIIKVSKIEKNGNNKNMLTMSSEGLKSLYLKGNDKNYQIKEKKQRQDTDRSPQNKIKNDFQQEQIIQKVDFQQQKLSQNQQFLLSIGENKKLLPIFSVNFSQSLENRLLLNNFGL